MAVCRCTPSRTGIITSFSVKVGSEVALVELPAQAARSAVKPSTNPVWRIDAPMGLRPVGAARQACFVAANHVTREALSEWLREREFETDYSAWLQKAHQ